MSRKIRTRKKKDASFDMILAQKLVDEIQISEIVSTPQGFRTRRRKIRVITPILEPEIDEFEGLLY